MFAIAMVAYPAYDKAIPEALIKGFESISMAFVAMLATTGRTAQETQPVQVVNEPGDPIPTEESK